MTSRIPNARDSIASIWEALTPSSDPHVRYKQARTLERLESVFSRRAFYFEAPIGAEESESGGNFALVDVRFRAVMRIDLSGRTFSGVFNDVSNEASLLMGSINFFNGSHGTGVRQIVARKWETQAADGDLDLVITFEAKVEEIDGTF